MMPRSSLDTCGSTASTWCVVMAAAAAMMQIPVLAADLAAPDAKPVPQAAVEVLLGFLFRDVSFCDRLASNDDQFYFIR